MVRRSALVVEHDPAVRAVVQDLLEGRGWRVTAVASRAEGFDLMDGLAPELLYLADPDRERVRRLVELSGLLDVQVIDASPAAIRTRIERVLN
jgi:CheY-like chemotaxis protein